VPRPLFFVFVLNLVVPWWHGYLTRSHAFHFLEMMAPVVLERHYHDDFDLDSLIKTESPGQEDEDVVMLNYLVLQI